MIATLHRTAQILFFLIGILLLGGIILLKADFYYTTVYPIVNSLDLPFLLSAMAYGGLSLFKSLYKPGRSGMIIGLIISVPLIALFIFFVIVNFWFDSKIVL